MALSFPGIMGGPEELVAAASPQNLTNAWADLGAELIVEGARKLALWVVLDINDSTDARIRLLAKRAAAGTDEYSLSIRAVAAGAITVQDEYIEFNDDADQSMVLSWDLDGLIPVVQFQIMAGAVGVSAGQVDAAHATAAF